MSDKHVCPACGQEGGYHFQAYDPYWPTPAEAWCELCGFYWNEQPDRRSVQDAGRDYAATLPELKEAEDESLSTLWWEAS